MRIEILFFLIVLFVLSTGLQPSHAVATSTIVLGTPDVDVLDDAFIDDNFPIMDTGTTIFLRVRANATNRTSAFIKFSTQRLPATSTIVDVQLVLNSTTNLFGGAKTTDYVNISALHVYRYPLFNISESDWDEGESNQQATLCAEDDMCFNTSPTRLSQYNTTADSSVIFTNETPHVGQHQWNVTRMFLNAFLAGDVNITVWLNVSTNSTNQTRWGMDFGSRNSGTSSVRPFLNITYIVPPELTGLALFPSSAFANATLNASTLYNDTELDNGTIRFSWYKNGINVQNNTLNVANGTNVTAISTFTFVHDDNVSVRAIANDSAGTSSPVSTANLTISDSPPTFLTAARGPPATVRTNDTYNVSVVIFDLDVDSTNVTFRFFKNGLSVLNTTVNKLLTNGTNISAIFTGFIHFDNLSVQVNATTRMLSTTVNLTNATIADAAPRIATAAFSPPSGVANTTFLASARYDDLDLDTGSLVFRFYKNGINVQNTTKSGVANATNSTAATTFSYLHYDNISFSVSATSNGLASNIASVGNITISDSGPRMLGASTSPSVLYEGGIYNASAIFQDIDLDFGGLTIKWYKNGVNVQNNTISSVANGTNVTAIAGFAVVAGDNVSISANATANGLVSNVASSANNTVSGDVPLINVFQLIITGVDTSPDVRLRLNVTAGPGATIDKCFFGATTVAPISDFCEINVTDALSQAGVIWANDSNTNTSRFFNWTVYIGALAEQAGFAHNQTVQRINRTVTVIVNDTANGIDRLEVNQSTPAGGALAAGAAQYVAAVANASTNAASAVFAGDWVNDNYTVEQQDTARQTEAGGATYTFRLVNLTNQQAFQFTNISLVGICRTGWDINQTATLGSSESRINQSVGCNTTNIVTISASRYNMTGTVIIALNSSAFLELLLNNTDQLIPYVNISVNISVGSLIPSGYVLDDASMYYLNIMNGSIALRNSTLATSPEPALSDSPTAAACLGFTIFAQYCYSESSLALSTTLTRYTSTIRHLVTVTNQQVKYFDVIAPFPLARFTNWAIRNAGSENATANSSAVNISIASDATYVNVTVGTQHGSSSLEPGLYLIDVNYTWDVSSGSGSPASGGGGGSSLNQTEDANCNPLDVFVAGQFRSANQSLPIKLKQIVAPGAVQQYKFGIENLGVRNMTVKFAIIGTTVDEFENATLPITGEQVQVKQQWTALDSGQTEGFDLVLSTPIGSEGNVYTGKVVAYCGSYSDSIEVQVLSSAQGDNPIAKFIGEELVLLGYSINKGIFIVAVFVITAAASSYKTKKVRLDVAAVIAIIAAVFLIL